MYRMGIIETLGLCMLLPKSNTLHIVGTKLGKYYRSNETGCKICYAHCVVVAWEGLPISVYEYGAIGFEKGKKFSQ